LLAYKTKLPNSSHSSICRIEDVHKVIVKISLWITMFVCNSVVT